MFYMYMLQRSLSFSISGATKWWRGEENLAYKPLYYGESGFDCTDLEQSILFEVSTVTGDVSAASPLLPSSVLHCITFNIIKRTIEKISMIIAIVSCIRQDTQKFLVALPGRERIFL